MSKKVKAVVKIQLESGKATPAPPVGPALGQYGIKLIDFCKQYNDATADKLGMVVPALVTIYEDRTFDLVIKTPPASALIKKMLGIKSGSKESHKVKVGTLSKGQLEEIAKDKMADLNTKNLESAVKIIRGTARSMGVTIDK